MQEKYLKSLVRSSMFFLISSILSALIITIFLYFELVSATTVNHLLYGAFITIAFITSITCARSVRTKGWLVGISVATIFIIFSLLYRLIGIEVGLGLGFLTRSGITLIVCLVGGMLGVNTIKS